MTGNRRQFIELLAGAALAPAFPSLAWGATRKAVTIEAPSSGVFDVTRFGAIPDGRTLATEGLQRAIDACAAAGGGTVLFPAGHYLSGALFLRSNLELHLAPGATLLASQDPEHYPPIKGRDEGLERTVYASLLTGMDLENLTIRGRGTIDGQGAPWWDADEVIRKARVDAKLPREADNPPGAPLRWPRPRTINLIRCRHVSITDLVIKDSPCVNVHLLYCEDVAVERLTTFQQRLGRSTEGVMVDSSKHIRIAGCTLSAGADCVSLKSGYNEDGRRVGLPSEDVIISECHLISPGGSGFAIGSEASAGVRNVLVESCVVQDCITGFHYRSPRGRGGVVENIRVSNVVIDRAKEVAVKLTNFWDSVRMSGPFGFKLREGRSNPETARSRAMPVNEGTPTFREFVFSGLTLGRMEGVALVEGLPERFITGLRFEDITLTTGKAGILCTMVSDVTISNLSMNRLEAPAVDAREVERLEISRLRCAHVDPQVPLVWLENVAGALVHGCEVGDAGPASAWLRQQQCTNVVLDDRRIAEPGK